MESKQSMVGKTIPVMKKDVGALAEKTTAELMAEAIQRYIRPPESPNDMVVAAHPDHGESIPIIDLARLLDSQTSQQEAALLKSACEDWGFFQVKNHGISDTLLENMRNNLECFFRLPHDERKKYGHVLPGEDGFSDSDRQTLNWVDSFNLTTQPPDDRVMAAWPTTRVNFMESIESYSSEMMRITRSLLQMIAKNLGVDLDKFRGRYDSVQALVMACYPACPVADKVLGRSPHCDVSVLTLVWELNPVQGLQIKRHGAWVPVKPHPKALVVNVGDILEILTNGKYKSIEHRVTVNPHKERMSISAFHLPKFDMCVGPLSEIAGGELKKYKTLRVDDILAIATEHEGDRKAMQAMYRV